MSKVIPQEDLDREIAVLYQNWVSPDQFMALCKHKNYPQSYFRLMRYKDNAPQGLYLAKKGQGHRSLYRLLPLKYENEPWQDSFLGMLGCLPWVESKDTKQAVMTDFFKQVCMTETANGR